MLGWCIKVFILAILVVTLGHFILEHFNDHLNQPKIHHYDASYKKILNVLESAHKERPEPIQPSPSIEADVPPPIVPAHHIPSQEVTTDTTSLDKLPPYEEPNMEDSLKEFIVNKT